MTATVLPALLRFHLHVGARLALRVLAPVIAAVVGAATLLGIDFVDSFAVMVFGTRQEGGSGVIAAVACFAVAAMAVPRVCRGLNGWVRHLPVSGVAQRRAALLALAVAQLPLLLLLMVLAFAAALFGSDPVPDFLGILVTAPAAALAAMPVERPLLVRPVAFAAAVLAVSGGWMALAGAAVLLVLADRLAGSLTGTAPSVAPRRGAGSGRWIEARIAWRALRGRVASALIAGLLPLGAGGLFIANNELAPAHVRLGALLAGGFGVVFLLADLGEALAVRRPAWPWSRSLPSDASSRVRFDTVFLAAHALPAVLLTGILDPLAAVAVLGLVPLLAARTAGAVRRAPERRTGASGEILMQGSLLAAATALLPWVALLALAGTPFALRAAAERERAQKVSRWQEIHHLAVGDPQSWSAG